MIKTFNFSPNGLLDPATNEPKSISFSQQDAFACLHDAYVDRVHRYVYFGVADDKIAEDITAQVFFEAWEELPVYQAGKSPIITWLYSLAHHAVVDHYRARKTSTPVDEAKPIEFNTADGVDRKPALQINKRLSAIRALQMRWPQDWPGVLLFKGSK